jgi:protoporphyrinogen oxidase
MSFRPAVVTESKPVVVVGGGPIGLISALYLARERGKRVIVIEQQPLAGGLYNSIPTPFGLVDQGVHIPQLTGVAQIDNLLIDALPPAQWKRLSGTRKDIAGNFFAGRLNEGSLYPDLRCLPQDDYQACLGDVMARASMTLPGFAEVPHLRAYFEARFGQRVTDQVMEPISRKFWRQPLVRMSPWAAKVVHLSRLVMHSPEATAPLKQSPALDAVIGYPDQLTVPADVFANSRDAYYPRQFGLNHVVDGLLAQLKQQGAEVLTGTELRGLSLAADQVQSISIARADKEVEQLVVDALVWTSPLAPLEKLLSLPAQKMMDAPVPHRVVHMALDQAPATGELYWLWDFDESDDLVRVSSPHAYCPAVANGGVFRLCAELHVPDATTTDGEAEALAERQLRMRGLIGASTRVMGSAVVPSVRVFPVLTVGNAEAIEAQRHTVEAACPVNLVLASQDLSAGIFYMPDILLHAVARMNHL